jgi:alpha-beta hydrolase superfamily lysophospholipase
MKVYRRISLFFVAALAGALILALTFGGPRDPTSMASISDPFRNVDFADLPAASHFTARDGMRLAFSAYSVITSKPKGSVVLIHGSSAGRSSMHVLAKAFAAAGYATYALDVRGHGESGAKGSIAYIGQMENDLEDFVRSIKPPLPATLAGFSSGGGFVLRFAGSNRQELFSNYLLLSPFISQDSPTSRPDSGGWVTFGLPRYLAIALLNAAGVHSFNGLTVIKFARDEKDKSLVASQYSYALEENFRPQQDYQANIRAVREPVWLIAGRDDEVFQADRFAEVFRSAGKDVPVTLLPGIGHIGVTLEPGATEAAVSAVRNVDELQPGTPK